MVSYLHALKHAYSYCHTTLVHIIYSVGTYSYRSIFYTGNFLVDPTPI